MSPRHSPASAAPACPARPRAYTLVELLVVMGVIVVILALAVPAVVSLAGAGNVNNAASEVADLLNLARAYALTHSTHVFVGFAETDGTKDASLNPQAAGTGRVAVAVAASPDGTSTYNGNPAGWKAANAASLLSVGKLEHLENLHLSATALPAAGHMVRPAVADSLQLGNSSFGSLTTFTWPIGASSPQYQFTRVIEFDPQGTAWYQASSGTPANNTMIQYLEIGLQPVRGGIVPAAAGSNYAAVQIDAMTGSIRVYRP